MTSRYSITPTLRSTEARSKAGFEAIGRIHHILWSGHAIDGHESFDAWIAGDGGYVVEWFGDPYAHEAAQAIIDLAEYAEDNTLQSDDIAASGRHSEEGRAEMRVLGLRLELRAMSPIGKEQVSKNLRPGSTGKHVS